jgi:hypothetical protein
MDAHDQPITSQEADASLGVIAAQQRALADRLVTPWWYHPVLGLLQGGMVLVLASWSVPVLLGGTVVYSLGVGLLVGAYQRLTGVWVQGLRAGRPGRISVALGVSFAVMAAAAVAARALGATWFAFVAAALVFVATVVLGRWFDQELRAELRGGA